MTQTSRTIIHTLNKWNDRKRESNFAFFVSRLYYQDNELTTTQKYEKYQQEPQFGFLPA